MKKNTTCEIQKQYRDTGKHVHLSLILHIFNILFIIIK